MDWPPVKAWTSKFLIEGQVHFVAINYGGKLQKKWVVLMSVLDSDVVVKVYWHQLNDRAAWECGWNESNYSDLLKLDYEKYKLKELRLEKVSTDSGLTIPITKNTIRPWFRGI